ncbi:RagB/SusD family nutrient uptake outer membrane protein [Cognatitamlana onchidii]|uniref:RagB/SusD family nutrient uptake outer membrane protein n=1 Tax=Cognatitamlana onchidii TaxID=2562860 RepID=UPI001455F4B4|nr:RagB/SusD family nutrient uptake outer membrane protein [Algibacter onchidii]
MKNNIFKIVFLVLLVSSCDDVLDETPDNRTSIDSPDKIAELLVGAYPEAAYASFLEPMTDNVGDKGPSAEEVRINQEMFFWRDINDVDQDTPTFYWNEAYAAIAQANQALASIDALGGGQELDGLRGEALLCRAYAHFMLVSIFCKAYNPATAGSDLGITYMTEPETVLLGKYRRGTIANVYDKIRQDIEAGIPLIEDTFNVPAYHFTKKAAHAFASRFYLHTGQWQKVIDHSNLALGGNDTSVLRDWENFYRPRTYSEQTTRYISSAVEPANLLLVSAASGFNRFHATARYQLNNPKRDELFPFFNETGKESAYQVFGSNDLFYNLPKFTEYFKVTNQATSTGEAFVTFVLLSTDEVIFNRAEAYAMLGRLENAVADINRSYDVKTMGFNPSEDNFTVADIQSIFQPDDPNLYTPFYNIPDESLAFIHAILNLKRTIFYNEGMRWFDIKRHNIEVEHRDIFGNSFVLPKDDLRRAVQIPEAAQSFGIDENPR